MPENVIPYDVAALCDIVAAHELVESQAYVPAGMFLGWIVENDLHGARVTSEQVSRFIQRDITGPRLFEELGGRLDEQLLGPHALSFADSYLGYQPGNYFHDFEDQFPVPSMFHVFDTWDNYEWIRITLVARYSEWRSNSDCPDNR